MLEFLVMKNILRWCFKNITQKYPGRILIIALLLSGFSIYISTGLSYDSRMDNLLFHKHSFVEMNES